MLFYTIFVPALAGLAATKGRSPIWGVLPFCLAVLGGTFGSLVGLTDFGRLIGVLAGAAFVWSLPPIGPMEPGSYRRRYR